MKQRRSVIVVLSPRSREKLIHWLSFASYYKAMQYASLSSPLLELECSGLASFQHANHIPPIISATFGLHGSISLGCEACFGWQWVNK